MATRPTAEEAARSLHDIDQRTDQALELMVARRWVYVVYGLAIFAFMAAQDFIPSNSVIPLAFLLVVAASSALPWTRRGAAVLGQPVQRHTQALSRKARVIGTLTVVAFVAACTAIGVTGVQVPLHIPYWRTGLGAILGIALGCFGPQIQRAMISVYKRKPGDTKGRTDGRR